jgi:hypothetical protein
MRPGESFSLAWLKMPSVNRHLGDWGPVTGPVTDGMFPWFRRIGATKKLLNDPPSRHNSALLQVFVIAQYIS